MGLVKRHEDWGAEIVLDSTETNRILREVDEQLPEEVSALLKEEQPKDIYATVVSSQFDADRLDYLQRDRLMTGVQFGHLDRDWLLDCLEVGSITVDESDDAVEVPCLYLNPKGIEVADEYLHARFRLYKMVYMHKTTRAAEKMLGALLERAVRELRDDLASSEPTFRFLCDDSPSLGAYMALDDSVVWASIGKLSKVDHELVSMLARRLLDRDLYKCVDVGVHQNSPNSNLHLRVKRKLRDDGNLDDVLIDDASVSLYQWYDFESSSALNKVLVKSDVGQEEPVDIVTVSPTIQARHQADKIWRIYAPDNTILRRVEDLVKATIQEAN